MTIIAFSGLDGSGKTTQAEHSKNRLEEAGFEVIYIHLIRWSLINKLGRLLKLQDNLASNKPKTGSQKKPRFARLRFILALFDLLRFSGMAFYQTKLRKRVLICDRFFFDLGIQAIYTGAISAKSLRLYWRLAPRASFHFWLEVAPEMALKREGDHQLFYYQRKRDLYLKHMPFWSVIKLDTFNLQQTQKRIEEIFGAHLNPNLE